MLNVSRTCKYAVIIISVIILLTFIIPYNPEDLYYVNKTIERPEGNPEITFINSEPNNPPDKNPSDGEGIPQNMGLPELSDSSKKMFIILVTGFRTGSTFLGELFNQNPDVLYLFEPFHQNHIAALVRKNAIAGVTDSNTLLEQRTGYLDQIINKCDVAWPMFGSMSQGMKCGTEKENLKRFGSVFCDKDEGKWNRACNRQDMVALKLIRLQRISHLELVPGIRDANVRVIHLIRDPRGTMNSRLAFGTFYLDDIENLKIKPLTPEKMGVAAQNLCEREWANIQFSEALPDWLKGSYMRITHDEMSLEPIESARKVYEFIGKPIPEDMEEFLIQHTTVQQKGILNTSKNSTAVLQKWKDKLQVPLIRAIEDKCKDLMDFMGYTPYQEHS